MSGTDLAYATARVFVSMCEGQTLVPGVPYAVKVSAYAMSGTCLCIVRYQPMPCPLSAMQCPVPAYAMSGISLCHVRYQPTMLRCPVPAYAVFGTDMCYAIAGTDLARMVLPGHGDQPYAQTRASCATGQPLSPTRVLRNLRSAVQRSCRYSFSRGLRVYSAMTSTDLAYATMRALRDVWY
eukprot:1392094-Rhodomonas_salina.6